jgi:hypothetical protein
MGQQFGSGGDRNHILSFEGTRGFIGSRTLSNYCKTIHSSKQILVSHCGFHLESRGTDERLNCVLQVASHIRDLWPTALRRANLLTIYFVHPIHHLSIDIRVSHPPGDQPTACDLVSRSRSARRILTWDAGWEFPWPLSASLAFLGKSSRDCLESMCQLLERQWDDHFPNARARYTLLKLV